MWGPFATSGGLETRYSGLMGHSVTPPCWCGIQ